MPKHDIFYKYSLKLRWPAICRNRSVETLQERPDLVDQMNRYREKVSNVLKIVCRNSAYIDDNHSMAGIRLWFESGQDIYDFIIRQPEFGWEIIQKLDVINIITVQMQGFDVVYTQTGVTID